MARRSSAKVITTVIWRRLDAPGHDLCQLFKIGPSWVLEGCAIFRDNRAPCILSYTVECDRGFLTRRARIRGRRGRKTVEFAITRDASSSWRLNGRLFPAVQGCIDVDINFSPATNLLSLRRLRPSPGQEISARVAWLNFPHARLTPLNQTYRPVSRTTYDYHAPDLDFRTQLRVDRHGMVLEYPPLWTQERGA